MSNQWNPQPKQEIALSSKVFELLYGGARGGGKTDAGIVWMIKPYLISNPMYRGLVIRANATDLDDWTDRAGRIYTSLGAIARGTPTTFEFPSGAKIKTGHLKDENAYTKYQGHEYQRMLIEELTQIPTEERYLKLLASCRSTVEGIDARIFCTANPGGVGHSWTKKRFIDPSKPMIKFKDAITGRYRMFIPATIDDNPILMKADPDYVKFLDGLPPDLMEAWRKGNWDLSNIKGAYYAEEIALAESENRICPLETNPYALVDVVWDLGMGGKADDQTAIFKYNDGRMIKIIDSFSTAADGVGRPWSYYIPMLKERGYNYGNMYLPHDGKKKAPDSLTSFQDVLEQAGYNVVIIGRTTDVLRDIQSVRALFSRFWFDVDKCKDLLEALASYRREYNDKRGVYSDHPMHDWTSHYADALRALAVSHEEKNIDRYIYRPKIKRNPLTGY